MERFQVRVVSVGPKTVLLVKMMRLVADLGLGDARELSDTLQEQAPCVLVAGVSQEVADHVAGLLRQTGSEVAVEPSSLEAPMLLCPQAGQKYRWSLLSGPTPIP